MMIKIEAQEEKKQIEEAHMKKISSLNDDPRSKFKAYTLQEETNRSSEDKFFLSLMIEA